MRRRRKGPDALLTAHLDQAVSELVRTHTPYCERCGRRDRKLDCAHIHGRQNRRLRWERRNLMTLCFVCHRLWHDHPLDAAEWIKSHRPEDVAWLEGVKNELGHYTLADKKALLVALRGDLEREAA